MSVAIAADMRTSLALAALATTLVGACGAPLSPESPSATTTAFTDARAPRASAGASGAPAQTVPASTIVDGPPPPAPRCRLTVTETENCQPHDVEALVAPVRSRLERCRGSSGGKLLVRVRKLPGGRLAFDVAPGTSLDPTERKCALDALNSLPQSESSTAWTGGPSIPPSGFSSLLTVEW